MNTFVWALIGNKADLQCEEVEKEIVEVQCRKLQTKLCYSVSAKTGQNVTKAFDDLIATIHRTQQSHQTALRKSTICIEDTLADNKNQKSCC